MVIDDRGYNMVLYYLQPVSDTCAVSLIWSLQEVTTKPHVESIRAQTLNSPECRNVPEVYDVL